MLEELELGRQATRATDGVVFGAVSIGFSGAFNHPTLPPLTRAVCQRFPDVTLSLTGGVMTRDGVEQLECGGLDIAFVGLPMDPSPLRTRLIGREPLDAALPVDHPLVGEAAIDLADLADDGFITHRSRRAPHCSSSRCRRVSRRASGRAWCRRSPIRT